MVAELLENQHFLSGAQSNPALVFWQAKAEETGVAPKLIATTSELDAIAQGNRDVPALHGWRAKVFGLDALRLAGGEIALSAEGGAIRVVDLT